jgi:CspA family cold shock protein
MRSMVLWGRDGDVRHSLGRHPKALNVVTEIANFPEFELALLAARPLRTPKTRLDSDRRRTGVRAAIYCQEAAMATGTVKWFNPTKGYGFIQPQGGGKDVFVHISAVERAGLSTLNEGQNVDYEVVANRGKESAENLKVK